MEEAADDDDEGGLDDEEHDGVGGVVGVGFHAFEDAGLVWDRG